MSQAQADVHARRLAERVEDVEFLLTGGESPTRIPSRLGLSGTAITRSMYRASRPDLARLFEPLAWRERPRGTCRICDGQTSKPTITTCWPCRYSPENTQRNAS